MPADAPLTELLTDQGLTPAQVTYLADTKGLTSIKKLANLFDARADVTAWCAGLDAPHSTSPDLLTGLKQAWREAEISVQAVAGFAIKYLIYAIQKVSQYVMHRV